MGDSAGFECVVDSETGIHVPVGFEFNEQITLEIPVSGAKRVLLNNSKYSAALEQARTPGMYHSRNS